MLSSVAFLCDLCGYIFLACKITKRRGITQHAATHSMCYHADPC